MKVFLSWSGDRSKQVAALLKTWLKCVIQSIEPWMSSQDISRGELWYTAINSQIAHISTGIICLTEENKEKPWILFEAGALAKGIATNHIITFLVDLKSDDLLLSPLSAFNHTTPDKDGVFKMILTINSLLTNPLEDSILTKVFEMFWPTFEDEFKNILQRTKREISAKQPIASSIENSELLKSVLITVRNLENIYLKQFNENRTNDAHLNNINMEVKTLREALFKKTVENEKLVNTVSFMRVEGDKIKP